MFKKTAEQPSVIQLFDLLTNLIYQLCFQYSANDKALSSTFSAYCDNLVAYALFMWGYDSLYRVKFSIEGDRVSWRVFIYELCPTEISVKRFFATIMGGRES
jgi:hypothetical protein